MPNGLEFNEIRKILPYSPPFLLVDRVVDWEANRFLVAEKAVSGSDPFVYNHLIRSPALLPGVIMIEAIGQAAMLLSILSTEGRNYALVLARCKASFKKAAMAGDQLRLKVNMGLSVLDKVHVMGDIFRGNDELCTVEIFCTRFKTDSDGSHFE